MKRILIIGLCLFVFRMVPCAQDTLRVMHYNLLNYGVITDHCTSVNNNVNDKNQYLKTILEYAEPHILTVNEIKCSVQLYDKLLNGCLDEYMPDMFERVGKTCPSVTDLSNMIYYRKDKLCFHSQDVVPTNYRDINVVKLYYNAPDLAATQDTIFLVCMIAHLKAGNDWYDMQERADEAARAMQYIEQLDGMGNLLLCGDLNVYNGSEQAFQTFVNHPVEDARFYDPINMIGDWNNNPSYAITHTQSTHTVPNCFISGGMDDRFDFILASASIMNNDHRMAYIPGSYHALGQDGRHFNNALTGAPQNTTVPQDVLHALYDMSDHLPVCMDLAVESHLGVAEPMHAGYIEVLNPVSDALRINVKIPVHGKVSVQVFTLRGKPVKAYMLRSPAGMIHLPVDGLSAGTYFVRLATQRGLSNTSRVLLLP